MPQNHLYILTGASRGMGLAMAQQLLRSGNTLICIARSANDDLAAIGHAILGDALYADAATQAQAPRLLLHASHLAFSHPATGTPVTLAWAEEFEENAASAPAFIAPEAIY